MSNDGDAIDEHTATARLVTVGDWTGYVPNESHATQVQRVRQGMWRAEHLRWPAGKPQKDKRVRDRYPTLPNWLAETYEGASIEDDGLNIMSKEARAYTRKRLAVLTGIDGKAEADRLWRNLLSSQPMAYSIAGHLYGHRRAAAALMAAMTGLPAAGLSQLSGGTEGLTAYALNGIETEWFPPRSEHTDDMSGCDIAACLALVDGRRALVTIEVKYTDTFSAKPVTWDRYQEHLTDLDLDATTTGALVKAGCSQVLRQVMIADSVRRRGLVAGCGRDGQVDQAVAVVLAREDDTAASRVAETLNRAVGAVLPVHFWSHRRLLDEAAGLEDLFNWAHRMAARYIGATSRSRQIRACRAPAWHVVSPVEAQAVSSLTSGLSTTVRPIVTNWAKAASRWLTCQLPSLS